MSRNRGRANLSQDAGADEERKIWKEIKDKSREIDIMVARSNDIGNEMIAVELQQATHMSTNPTSNATLDERLEKLYRENVKLCEEVQHIIEGKSNDTNLLESLKILSGLREASEESALSLHSAGSSQRGASGKFTRGPKKGGKPSVSGATSTALSTEDGDESPAAPSPRISLGSRLVPKDKTSRAGSVPTTRETSVKLEDAESVASSGDSTAAPGSAVKQTTSSILGGVGGSASTIRQSNRLVLTKGEIVFCRHDTKSLDAKKEAPEGEGILCRVTAVIGEGKQRRYEVQDADNSGEAPPPQRASVSQLIQIPEGNRGLSDLPKGKQVLAQYPDTTTFYKAEVGESWRARDAGLGRDKAEWVKLSFQDDEMMREVERRFVLTER